MTITLPITTDCEAQGAICTADNRMLSEPVQLTITPPPNSPATGAPTIGGTAQVGETLTADTSGIEDEDGLTGAAFSYQWIANDGTADMDVRDATASTYALADADEGKTIRVRVAFVDDGGNEESLTSTATATVQARPNSPGHGSADHKRDVPGGRDAHGGHVRHLRRRWPERCDVQLPVDSE